MSSIVFGGTVSMLAVATPSSGWLIGYDTDGILKQKDQFGIIKAIKEVISGPTGATGNGYTYEIGEYVPSQGGVIFHRYKDGSNENYLVVAIDDQSTGTTWSNITDQLAGADSTWNGLENSLTITGQTGHTESAAQLCLEYVNGGCDTISVTYTLGEDPVTVEVEQDRSGSFLPFYIDNPPTPITGIWISFIDNEWVISSGMSSPITTQATLSENTPCPFGVFTIEEGSIFESFSVAPVNPINDWYLPAIDELSLLWQNRFNVNRTLSGNSSYGSIPSATQIDNNNYWSSRESDSNYTWVFPFSNGSIFSSGKDNSYYVRSVRKFSI